MKQQYWIWVLVGVVALLIFLSVMTWRRQAQTTQALQTQTQKFDGIQGEETISAKDLLDKMSASMEKPRTITIQV